MCYLLCPEVLPIEPACRTKKTGKALDQTMPSTVTERYALMVKPSDFNMA